MAPNRPAASVETIAKIEEVFKDIVHSLLQEEEISIPLRLKGQQVKHCDQSDPQSGDTYTYVNFPASTHQEARRFAVIFRILELIHEALCDNVVVSKRNIYYKDPALFKRQNVVDRYVDILAYTFGVTRAEMNVSAAAKGLVIGHYDLIQTDGTRTRQDSMVSHLVVDTYNIPGVDIPYISWILIVEKESTFRTLASNGMAETSGAGKGIILTAKGYPDLSTRAFLHLLSTYRHPILPPPAIFMLADYDPDGMAILSVYKHGSRTLSHENAHLVVPSIQWIGLQSKHLMQDSMDEDYQGLLRLSGRDRNKAVKMLQNNPVLREDGTELRWRRELQVMLMLNVKAEMEVLGERKGGVVGWVEEQLLASSKSSLMED